MLGLALVAYLVVMSPWYLRNLGEWGRLMPPGGSRTLWLTDYNQTYIYPAESLSFSAWWASGLKEILLARVGALWLNFKTMVAVQGGVALLPLILIGGWRLRRNLIVQTGVWMGLGLLILMTIIFPFSGSRGGFFHSGAAIQPLLWALAAIGLDRVIDWGSKARGWRKATAWKVFSSGLVVLMAFVTLFIGTNRLFGTGEGEEKWSAGFERYQAVESWLREQGGEGSIVMVNNPPGYYVAGRRAAIVIPFGELETVQTVADRYGAVFLVLERNTTPQLKDLYLSPHSSTGLTYLAEVNGAQIFQFAGQISMISKLDKPWRIGVWSLLAAGLALGTYLAVAGILGQIGFPLDDAWIHQAYARSLALRGEWAYWPGEVSAGSTSPLWTVLLIPGQWIPHGMFFWTFFLGWLGLAGSAWLGQMAYQHITQPETVKLPIMALLLALEWHLVWAAGSGMETILYVLLILAVFAELTRKNPRYWLVGGLAGLTGWVRPDGLTLLGPVLFTAVLSEGNRREMISRIGQSLVGFLALFVPYLAFNYFLAGSIWPNTLYAKQAEYAIMTQEGFVTRLLKLIIQPTIGVGILLLPGVVWGFYRGFKRHNWVVVAIGLFWLGNSVLYAWRLPVIYQHARYLIPSMAAYYLLGFCGMIELLQMFVESKQIRLFRFGWKLAIDINAFALLFRRGDFIQQ